MPLGKKKTGVTRKHTKPAQFEPGKRYKQKRIIYPWKQREIGRKALSVIACNVDRHGTLEDHAFHSAKDLNLDLRQTFDELKTQCPAVFKDHHEFCGTELTLSKVRGRYGNMFRNNKQVKFCIGEEHPFNYCPEVYMAVRKRLEKTNWKGPIT